MPPGGGGSTGDPILPWSRAVAEPPPQSTWGLPQPGPLPTPRPQPHYWGPGPPCPAVAVPGPCRPAGASGCGGRSQRPPGVVVLPAESARADGSCSPERGMLGAVVPGTACPSAALRAPYSIFQQAARRGQGPGLGASGLGGHGGQRGQAGVSGSGGAGPGPGGWVRAGCWVWARSGVLGLESGLWA